MLDLVLVASILLYAVIVKLHSLSVIKTVGAGLVAVLLPFILSAVVAFIRFSAHGNALAQIISTQAIVLLVLQVAFSLFIFRRLELDGDSIGAWATWAIAGCAGIFFVLPYLVGMVA